MFKKMMATPSFLIVMMVTAIFMSACNSTLSTSPKENNDGIATIDNGNMADVQVEVETTYAGLTLDEMIGRADVVFIGKVTDISPTQWNQDSGEYWEKVLTDEKGLETIQTALPIYRVEMDVVRSLVDEIGLEKHVVLTAIGTAEEINKSAGSLKIGDTAVVFVQQTEIAWRDGTKTVLELMGVPTESYLRQGTDGLYHSAKTNESAVSIDELTMKIAQKRTGTS